MRQPIKNKKKVIEPEKNLDGSGLETYFRINVLDKLGVKYIQQYEAKSIGRFYDFYIPSHNILIECDGDFYHANPKKYNDKISNMQKKNKRVDEHKNKWAILNCFVLLRFWECDIYNDTQGIINQIKERIGLKNKLK